MTSKEWVKNELSYDCLTTADRVMLSKVLQDLERLEAIDNANPSEALKSFKNIEERCKNDYENCIVGYDYEKELLTIKQALLKAQEQEKENARYKRLEEELDCSLEIVLKALKDNKKIWWLSEPKEE